jgi:hypothetical protein
MEQLSPTDDKVAKLLADVSSATFEAVARGALDDRSTQLVGKTEWQGVGGRHADRTTVAMMKCTGRAISGGVEKSWSVVLKHIDLSVEANAATESMNQLNEINFYRDGTFVTSDVPFRAARCYHIDEHGSDRFSLWLEDLSASDGPPWSADQYERASNCLGQFQGKLLAEQTRLPNVAEADIFKNRWDGWNLDQVLQVLLEQPDHPEIKTVFAGGRLDLVVELMQSFPALLEQVGGVEKVLSHGDCHARNLFLDDGGLVAIDWSGISYEPIGSDFGQMIGAGLSWGFDERIAVAEAAPRFFDAYVEGLSEMGWDGDERTLRLGMAGQFIGYVILGATMPARLIIEPEWLTRFEGRAGIPGSQISAATARFLELVEPFMREAIELANGE